VSTDLPLYGNSRSGDLGLSEFNDSLADNYQCPEHNNERGKQGQGCNAQHGILYIVFGEIIDFLSFSHFRRPSFYTLSSTTYFESVDPHSLHSGRIFHPSMASHATGIGSLVWDKL
jgi:hypothetical protein